MKSRPTSGLKYVLAQHLTASAVALVAGRLVRIRAFTPDSFFLESLTFAPEY